MTHSYFIRYVTLYNGGNESRVQDENSVSFSHEIHKCYAPQNNSEI